MSKKKYPSKPAKTSKASEPKADFGKRITFFNSFEEMNEHDEREMAQFTPLENLQHATALIKRVFAAELKKKPSKLKLRFK